MRFRKGLKPLEEEERRRSKHVPFEAGDLPDSEKERLCRSLLAEFGVTKITPREPKGELIHGCVLPFKAHQNQDHDPTASLNYKKLTYKCFGCSSSGGLLWFIGTVRGTSGTEAREWLHKQAGLGAEEQSLPALLAYFDQVYNPQRHVLPPIPKMGTAVLEPWLLIHPYMTEIRGCPEETLMRFKVGYGTFNMRVGESFVKSERIVIPHFWKGDLVGWQTRRLIKDGTPKYRSSADFPKDQTIYNFAERGDTAVVVESPLSVLRHHHHVPNLESTFGASITDRQVKLLANHRKVVLWLDNDEAGWNATERLGAILEAYSSVWVVDSPWAEDPAGMDDDTVESLLADPVPYALWRRPKTLQEWAA